MQTLLIEIECPECKHEYTLFDPDYEISLNNLMYVLSGYECLSCGNEIPINDGVKGIATAKDIDGAIDE